MTTPKRDLHEQNRRSWNLATQAHNSHKGDQAAFLRGGGTTLSPEELELLGDVRGKRLVHLQCNAGQDTLSLAQLGAVVTGVDISDEAVAFATRLSAESGIPGRFVRADVYDWLAEAAEGEFDLAFSSYGAICWLSDLETWASGIARTLKPGGRFALVEFHPTAWMFEEDWTLKYPYRSGGRELTFEEGIGDYVAAAGESLAPSGYEEGVKDFVNPEASHEFAWALADVIGAFLRAGMVLERFEEYPYSNGAALFQDMGHGPGNRRVPPAHVPEGFPLMFGVAFRKPD